MVEPFKLSVLKRRSAERQSVAKMMARQGIQKVQRESCFCQRLHVLAKHEGHDGDGLTREKVRR